jgi:hypothetical protein
MLLARAKPKRMIELADLSSLECLGDGLTHRIALVTTMKIEAKSISMAKQNIALPLGTRTLKSAASWHSICFTDGRSVASPSQRRVKGENCMPFLLVGEHRQKEMNYKTQATAYK